MFSNGELALMKNTFADNEELLYAIRAILLQFPLTAAQYDSLRAQLTPEVLAVVRKRIFPDLDPEAPLGQLGDIYQTLTTDLRSKSVEDMAPLFAAKKLERDYLEQQFAVLKSLDFEKEQKIKLDALAVITDDMYTNYVQTTARNFLLGYIDPMLLGIKTLAGQKEETPEQQKERLTRNSNK